MPATESIDEWLARLARQVARRTPDGSFSLSTDEAAPAAAAKPQADEEAVLGMTVVPLSDEMIAEMGLPSGAKGVVIKDLAETSDAFDKGLRPGDLITEAGQQPVASPADLAAQVAAAKEGGRKSVLLLIRRGGEPRFVALSVE